MYQAFRPGILVAALVLLAGVASAQVAQTNDPAKIKAKLLASAYIEGKLAGVEEEERQFRLQHVIQVKKWVRAYIDKTKKPASAEEGKPVVIPSRCSSSCRSRRSPSRSSFRGSEEPGEILCHAATIQVGAL